MGKFKRFVAGGISLGNIYVMSTSKIGILTNIIDPLVRSNDILMATTYRVKL